MAEKNGTAAKEFPFVITGRFYYLHLTNFINCFFFIRYYSFRRRDLYSEYYFFKPA